METIRGVDGSLKVLGYPEAMRRLINGEKGRREALVDRDFLRSVAVKMIVLADLISLRIAAWRGDLVKTC